MNGRVLVRTSFLLIVLTAGVKLLGFARDQVVAFVFGAGPITDAFYIALTLPMVLVSMIGGTFSTAFVPVLTDLWQKDRAAGWRTMRSVGSGYLGIVIAVAAGVVVGAPLLTHVLGPGLPPSTRPLVTQLIRAFSVGFVFWAMYSALAGVLNSRKTFIVPACGPIMLNATILVVLLVAGRRLGIAALALGTVLGMFMQFLIQVPFVIGSWAKESSEVTTTPGGQKRVWAMVGPLLLFGLLSQAPTVVDKAVASGLAQGSVSVLAFAQKLMSLPIGLFVGAVATVFYTSLSEAWARKDPSAAADELALAMGVTLLLAIPAAVGLAVLSHPIVQFVFQHGRFDAVAAALTSHALVFYCLGLPLVAVNLVLLRNAYASEDIVSPLRGYVAALIVNAAGDWILSRVMGPAGIALASSLGAITLALSLILSWDGHFRIAVGRALRNSLSTVLVGTALMGGMVVVLSSVLGRRPVWFQLLVPGVLGLAVYVLMLAVTRPREIGLLVAKAGLSTEPGRAVRRTSA